VVQLIFCILAKAETKSMTNLIVKESSKTPYFRLNGNGHLSFGGISMPEDAASFYFDIIDWISDYYRKPNSTTFVQVGFSYLNSSSSSMILKIFLALKRLQETGKTKVICKWYYDVEDNDMREYIDLIIDHAGNIEFEVCPTPDVRDLKFDEQG